MRSPCKTAPQRPALGALLATAVLCLNAAHAADWSDTTLSYRYGSQFSEPGIDADVAKHIVALTHVSGYQYGSHFFNVDALISDENDPANNSTDGAQELYLVYNHQLHLSKVLGQPMAFGPVTEVAFSTGFDLSAKNTAFAPRVQKLILGPTLKFSVAGGWADLSLLYYKENNHNGIVGKEVSFDATYRIGAAWGIPFALGTLPLSFNGFLNYTGAKGKDGFGADTKAETLLNAFVMADLGALAGTKGRIFAGLGYEYWQNKFGADHAQVPGSTTHAPMLKAEWHF